MHDMSDRIEELANNKLDMRMGVKRELKKLPSLLLDAEEVLNLARGQYDGKQGLIVLTDRRVMFVEEGMVRSRLEDFPYGRVSSVQSEKGMMFGRLIIFASGNKAEIKDVAPKDRATEIGDYVRSRIAEGSSSNGAAPASVADDPYEALRKLGQLRDAGVISPDEFEAKKASLLERI
jgi:hypothetical protein